MSLTEHPVTRTQRWLTWGSVSLLVLTAVFVGVVSVMAVDGPGLDDGTAAATTETIGLALVGLLFIAWNVAPLVAGAWFVVLVKQYWPRESGAIALGSVVVTALTVVALRDFMVSDSSTAALIFIFLPLPLWLVLGGAIGTAVLLEAVVARRARRGAGST